VSGMWPLLLAFCIAAIRVGGGADLHESWASVITLVAHVSNPGVFLESKGGVNI
jgi:hypothetical protein